jgi:hypothetical protein
MPGSGIMAAAPEGGASILYLAWEGALGLLGFCLTLNVGDSAYRIYEFATNRLPYAPGPAFSPLVIRSVGACIGAVSTWSFVHGLIS